MTEDQLEQEALGWLTDVGWQHRYGPDLAPDGSTPERDNARRRGTSRDVRRRLFLGR